MRKALMIVLAAGFGTAATAASADYFLKIEGISQPAPNGPIYLKVLSSADPDGGGAKEAGVVRILCAGGKLKGAHFNGGGFTVDNWVAPPPKLTGTVSYDIKKVEGTGARMSAGARGWVPIGLKNSDALCAEAQAAAAIINTSRSNIKY